MNEIERLRVEIAAREHRLEQLQPPETASEAREIAASDPARFADLLEAGVIRREILLGGEES